MNFDGREAHAPMMLLQWHGRVKLDENKMHNYKEWSYVMHDKKEWSYVMHDDKEWRYEQFLYVDDTCIITNDSMTNCDDSLTLNDAVTMM